MGQTIESGQLLSIVASFVLVIVLLFATLWLLRRIGLSGLRSQAGRRLAIVDSLWLGNRQRIALVRVDERELVIGISGQSISLIAELTPASLGETARVHPSESSSGEDGETVAPDPRPSVRAEDRGRFLEAMRGILNRDTDKGAR